LDFKFIDNCIDHLLTDTNHTTHNSYSQDLTMDLNLEMTSVFEYFIPTYQFVAEASAINQPANNCIGMGSIR
jgi:phosphoglucomutase